MGRGLPYGFDLPFWAFYGPILLTEFISQIFQKTNNFDENHKIINKRIKVVNLEILKVKTWFCDKDLFSENFV